MIQISYRVQHFDYSSTDLWEVTEQNAFKEFEKYTWSEEFSQYQENDDLKNCPPWMGFQKKWTQLTLLHICPNKEKGKSLINFYYPKDKDFLWLFKWSIGVNFSKLNVPDGEIAELIHLFFIENYDSVLKLLKN